MSNDNNSLAAELRRFTGSETIYRHFNMFHYTEGIRYLADKASSYWLIDLISSYQPELRKNQDLEAFQVWYLTKTGAKSIAWKQPLNQNGCLVSCWRDMPTEKSKPACIQEVDFTDFPLLEINLYVCNGVLMLPSEY